MQNAKPPSKAKKALGHYKIKDWQTSTYFYITAPVVGIIALLAIIYPKAIAARFADLGTIIYTLFDWFIMWTPLAILLLCLYLALSKFGKKIIGGKDAKPEYSLFSWLSMLFTAGIGVGIIFYGPLEGLGIWRMVIIQTCLALQIAKRHTMR